MQFECDDAKNRENCDKHGISFEEVRPLFATDYAVEYDGDRDEDRFIAIGPVDARLVFVVFTEPSSETIRIISARDATLREARRYRAYKEGIEP